MTITKKVIGPLPDPAVAAELARLAQRREPVEIRNHPWLPRTPPKNSHRLWVDDAEWRSRIYPQNLIYQSRSGCMVRSKSEMAIADLLWARDIGFLYEPTLHDSCYGGNIQPDFLLVRDDGALFCWEHCGVDTDEYKKSWDKKLAWYYDHGIYDDVVGPCGTLVVSTDGNSNPLSTYQLDKWIDLWYTLEVPDKYLQIQRDLTHWKGTP